MPLMGGNGRGVRRRSVFFFFGGLFFFSVAARQILGQPSLKKNAVKLGKKAIETIVGLMHKLVQSPILDHTIRF